MKRLELLDYARFFAAIAVVLYHYTFLGINNEKLEGINYIPWLANITKYGYLGVELFFMISGYVIFYSAQNRSATAFMVNRAARLYPAYWFAVLFTAFFVWHWGGDLMTVYPIKIIANLTLLQSFVGIGNVDGVYWTLAYELSFYFGVFVLLILGLKKYLRTIFIFWPVIFLIARILNVDTYPYLGGYYYYFSAGVLLAMLAQKIEWKAVASLVLCYLLCIDYSASKAQNLTEITGFIHSFWLIGLVVTVFFMLFLYQNTNNAKQLSLPLSNLLGGLTYPVYLIHAYFGYIVINWLATDENKVLVYGLTLLVVIVVAMFMHIIIEKKWRIFWLALFNSTLGAPLFWLQRIIKRRSNKVK